jgi:hypothetical protein
MADLQPASEAGITHTLAPKKSGENLSGELLPQIVMRKLSTPGFRFFG